MKIGITSSLASHITKWHTVPLFYLAPFSISQTKKLAIKSKQKMAPASGNALPDGWLIRVSRSKGKVYYYNTRTKETRWTRPTAGDEAGDQALPPPAAAVATAVTIDEQVDREATRKRQRTDAAKKSDATVIAAEPVSRDGGGAKAVDAGSAISKTRGMIAMSMRVGGSAFVARQSSFGTLASTQNSKPRAAFTPWDHQLEAIEGMVQEIQEQDADSKAKVCVSLNASHWLALGYNVILTLDHDVSNRHTLIGSCCSTVLAPARR